MDTTTMIDHFGTLCDRGIVGNFTTNEWIYDLDKVLKSEQSDGRFVMCYN